MSQKDPDRQKTILCVDDEEGTLSALTRVLRPLSHRILKARDGKEALALARTAPPNLIILDVRMPEMDGYEVLRRLRREGMNDIPVVMLTADRSDQGLMESYGQGGTYHLTKPCKGDSILNIVQYLIGDLSEEERRCLELKL